MPGDGAVHDLVVMELGKPDGNIRSEGRPEVLEDFCLGLAEKLRVDG
jgi:hypothetical protein